MTQKRKSRTFNPCYESPQQGLLPGFENPFERQLDLSNRWVVLSHLLPWDSLCNVYLKNISVHKGAGRKPLNPRIVLGAVIIKHMLNLDDRETVDQIAENIYMQYFLGYTGFTSEKPFDASLFVEIRKRLSLDVINAINETIVNLKTCFEADNSNVKKEVSAKNAPLETADAQPEKQTGQEESSATNVPLEAGDLHTGKQSGQEESSIAAGEKEVAPKDKPTGQAATSGSSDNITAVETKENTIEQPPSLPAVGSEATHKGSLILDATVCPQDIAFPTDLDLLSSAREKSEELIDSIYNKALHGEKPRTYRKIARKEYLRTAQKKKKTKKQIRNAIRKQLGYLCRNIRSINRLLDAYSRLPFDRHELKYFYVIQTLFDKQIKMFKTRTHTVDDRIVSIHQPHVRPIVRGKTSAPVEFGSKISLSLIDGISFLDELSWDAFHEGTRLMHYIEKYRKRFGFYPRIVKADKIYCSRENRMMLKEKGITLRAKPLGRPSSATALSNHVSPGERNPIEGKFGQAKTAYGLNRVKARLKITSESWIAGIILVLNLVKLAGAAAPCLIMKVWRDFSARFCRVGTFIIMYKMFVRRSSCSVMNAVCCSR